VAVGSLLGGALFRVVIEKVTAFVLDADEVLVKAETAMPTAARTPRGTSSLRTKRGYLRR
jgi:hypothetical protein